MAWGAIIGSAIGAAASFLGNERSNKQTAASTRDQMAFQERMRDTQYQASMKDMRQAGLNPIFAYQQGGAGTPSGSSATFTNSAAAGMDAFSKTTASALAMKTNVKQLKLLDQQIRHTNMLTAKESAATGKLASDEDLNYGLLQKVNAEAQSARAIAQANETLKRVTERDAKYQLDNPALMKVREWAKALGAILGGGNSAKTLIK